MGITVAASTHTSMHARKNMQEHTHAHTHTHARTHARTHTHTHTHTHPTLLYMFLTRGRSWNGGVFCLSVSFSRYWANMYEQKASQSTDPPSGTPILCGKGIDRHVKFVRNTLQVHTVHALWTYVHICICSVHSVECTEHTLTHYVSWCGGESWVDQRVPRAYIHDVALLL